MLSRRAVLCYNLHDELCGLTLNLLFLESFTLSCIICHLIELIVFDYLHTEVILFGLPHAVLLHPIPRAGG